MIVFLDFDGPLHPDEAYNLPGRGIVLKTANLPDEYQDAELFCYMPLLENVLADYPEVRLVLSTTWAESLGLEGAKQWLSPALQARVIGATHHPQHTPRWHYQSRFQQILDYVAHHRLGSQWLAIDNDNTGWPDNQYDNLVLTDDYAGLSDPKTLALLRARLDLLRLGKLGCP